jgi:tRNA (cmo5U34)-methyltransferase
MLRKNNIYDQTATSYDAFISEINPAYKKMQDVCIDVLMYAHPDCKLSSVLELGVGTGMLAFKILSKFSVKKYTGYEISDNLISLATSRLSVFVSKIDLSNRDFRGIKHTASFEAAVSTMTFHYLSNKDKKIVFKNIYDSLKYKGIFLIGDRIISNSPFLKDIFAKRMISSWDNTTKNWRASIRKPHNTVADSQEEPWFIEDQLLWLKEVGFSEVACIWRDFNYCVFYGIKK